MGAPENPWVMWEGGECPVDPDAMVRAQFRCENRNEADEADSECPAGDWDWSHRDSPFDIIAYRVVSK